MQPASKRQLMDFIRQAAVVARVNWEDHYASAEQVIVFGSFAAGMQTTNSDLDVLCVGNGQNVLKEPLHVLWLSDVKLEHHVRKGSELACHIAAYGVWLKGERTLPPEIQPSVETVLNRRESIHARLIALRQNWTKLTLQYRLKHAWRIRRDLQRLVLLQSGRPNMPRPALDRDWADPVQRRYYLDWFKASDVAPLCPTAVIRLMMRKCQFSSS
jgi:predicted nucleotidyltransferase